MITWNLLLIECVHIWEVYFYMNRFGGAKTDRRRRVQREDWWWSGCGGDSGGREEGGWGGEWFKVKKGKVQSAVGLIRGTPKAGVAASRE